MKIINQDYINMVIRVSKPLVSLIESLTFPEDSMEWKTTYWAGNVTFRKRFC